MYERDRRDEFKDVPWQQGRLLMTNNTRHWSKEQCDEADDVERCTAFAHFSASDEGRGRAYVHQFRSAKECAAAIEEHNDALKAANVQGNRRDAGPIGGASVLTDVLGDDDAK